MDDHLFRQMLDTLELSREGYRRVRKGVKKRIVRHMQPFSECSSIFFKKTIRAEYTHLPS